MNSNELIDYELLKSKMKDCLDNNKTYVMDSYSNEDLRFRIADKILQNTFLDYNTRVIAYNSMLEILDKCQRKETQ